MSYKKNYMSFNTKWQIDTRVIFRCGLSETRTEQPKFFFRDLHEQLVIGEAWYSQLQIGWHKILRSFLKKFNLVPGVPGDVGGG